MRAKQQQRQRMATLNLEYQASGGQGIEYGHEAGGDSFSSENIDFSNNSNSGQAYRASSIFAGPTGRPHDDLKVSRFL